MEAGQVNDRIAALQGSIATLEKNQVGKRGHIALLHVELRKLEEVCRAYSMAREPGSESKAARALQDLKAHQAKIKVAEDAAAPTEEEIAGKKRDLESWIRYRAIVSPSEVEHVKAARSKEWESPK